jgi:hypothetical protein
MPPPEEARRALHRLNGIMINHLVKRVFAEISWEEWIVNAIILHRTLAAVETVTLETSATLHKNKGYYSYVDCGPNEPVKRLDGDVPLDDSFAGYCIRTGNIVWVDDLAILDKNNPLWNEYRSFGYVGVRAPAPPKAEYVFPIRLRIGLSEAIWGVLNCEWYGTQACSPFQSRGQASVGGRIGKLLNVHARFLPAVIDPDECSSNGDAAFHDEALFHYYARTLERLVPAERLEGSIP